MNNETFSHRIFVSIFVLIIFICVAFISNQDKFVYGVGIHSSHYIDFNGMKELGVGMVREDACWACVEKTKGVYNFSNLDRLVKETSERNIGVLLILDYTNIAWAPQRENKYAWVDCSNESFAKLKEGFGKFTYETALRYKGKIKYFEIWNEPNYHFCVESRSGTELGTVKYGELLKEAYIQVKKANPDAVIISAGTATSTDIIEPFFNNLYKYQYNKYFDILGVHPYCFPQSPPYKSECSSFTNLKIIRSIMEMYGDGNKDMWITETGIPSGGCSMSTYDNCNIYWESNPNCCNLNLSLENQAVHLPEVFRFIKSDYPYVSAIFWYDYMEDKFPINNTEGHFGLVYKNLTRKPAWYAYQNVIKED